MTEVLDIADADLSGGHTGFHRVRGRHARHGESIQILPPRQRSSGNVAVDQIEALIGDLNVRLWKTRLALVVLVDHVDRRPRLEEDSVRDRVRP